MQPRRILPRQPHLPGGSPGRADEGVCPYVSRDYQQDSVILKETKSKPGRGTTGVRTSQVAPDPLLAIVGRPNVGKSTLFNRLIGSRRAIVGDEPGITRDRLYGETTWNGRRLRIVDTGGIIPDDKDFIPAEIFRQARLALEEASAIVLVVDVRTELAGPDFELAQLLRRVGKPLFLAVNKLGPALLAGCTVTVHQHLDGTFTITHGPQRLGHYSADGVSLENNKIGGRKAVEKTQAGKVKKPTFPPCLEIPHTPRDSHFPTASAATGD